MWERIAMEGWLERTILEGLWERIAMIGLLERIAMKGLLEGMAIEGLVKGDFFCSHIPISSCCMNTGKEPKKQSLSVINQVVKTLKKKESATKTVVFKYLMVETVF